MLAAGRRAAANAGGLPAVGVVSSNLRLYNDLYGFLPRLDRAGPGAAARAADARLLQSRCVTATPRKSGCSARPIRRGTNGGGSGIRDPDGHVCAAAPNLMQGMARVNDFLGAAGEETRWPRLDGGQEQ